MSLLASEPSSMPKPALVPSCKASLSVPLPPPELGTVLTQLWLRRKSVRAQEMGPDHLLWYTLGCCSCLSGTVRNQKAGLLSARLFCLSWRIVFSSPLEDALCAGWCSACRLEQGHSEGVRGLCVVTMPSFWQQQCIFGAQVPVCV